MARPKIIPRNQERDFDISELFFSTTDPKGIITFGNSVFVRISAYNFDELLNEPHNIIRHPDMPRCVFKLLWDYILAGKTIGAYVKNLAKDGCYYWVIAVVMPCEGGFLSIRLKPSTEIFGKVEEVYKDILQVEADIEKDQGQTDEAMAAGTQKLLENLKDIGFSNYDEFMLHFLEAEMIARQKALSVVGSQDSGAPMFTGDTASNAAFEVARLHNLLQDCSHLDSHLKKLFSQLSGFSSLNKQLLTKSTFILNLAETIRLLSLNAVFESDRIKGSGATLRAIAQSMGERTGESSSTMLAMNKNISTLNTRLANIVLEIISSKLQIEMATDFSAELIGRVQNISEGHENGVSIQELLRNIKLLLITFDTSVSTLLPQLEQLQVELREINDHIEHLFAFMKALRFIHSSGKVEAARNKDAAAFEVIFDSVYEQVKKANDELKEFKAIVASNLETIEANSRLNSAISDNLSSIKSLEI